jgi:hypothetical protein
MEAQREFDYSVLSFSGKIYHIILPNIEENYTLCRKSLVESNNLDAIRGKSSLIELATVIWPQVPRPGILCKQCLKKIAKLHDRDHISDEEYERLVLGILQGYYEGKGKQILHAKQGKSNIWVGQSGCKHQIDVSLELEDEIVLAECKCLNQAVDLPLALTFLARVIDIKPTIPEKFVHGILFSNINFQGGSNGNIYKLQEYYHEYITLQVINSYGWPTHDQQHR